MSSYVERGNHPITNEIRSHISERYRTITYALNKDFWGSSSDTAHSKYVGSYGRGTAIPSSDLDVLFELPASEYNHFTNLSGNGPSRLLQSAKLAIIGSYPRTDIRGDGQVVVISFSDGMRFEILPAFAHHSIYGYPDGAFTYPNTHNGGNWMTTDPLAEQVAMKEKNGYSQSNGLLFDTCKHIRFVHSSSFSSYHLSGIMIDSFVFSAIKDWHWLRDNEDGGGAGFGAYERVLLDYYNSISGFGGYAPTLYAPGSRVRIDTSRDWTTLGKILNYMV